ncbi:hypothetical protein ACH95_00065 [Bacillus glycinifermentans]|uniref:hypothetical protein n=1 Tax=Bacillus glycinifermentans TaxID=1664069 RepID=UPI0006528D6C|nr:hypothetical protein [Bacillus glycinifermentans]KMM63526.1 hypothetical protein ACH95_00065 [Bacillus glycinifermentans]MEC0493813.1 hypothetical protein [Bacillus glycinifermentans]MEC0543364.1 hypothetical protein [Bacillus glycinifermentans]
MIAEIKSFSFNATNGDMGLEIYSDFSAENLQLLWQKRQDSSSLSLYEGKFVKLVKDDKIINIRLNMNDIIDAENLDQKDEIMWDCFLTDGVKKLSVSFPNSLLSQYNYYFFDSNNLFKIVPYVTKGSKTLALYIRPVSVECSLESMSIKDGKLSGEIAIKSKDTDIQKFDLTLCYRKRECKDIFHYIENIDANIKINSFLFEHDLNEVFLDKLEDALWDFL